MKEFVKIIDFKKLSCAFAVILLAVLLCTSIFSFKSNMITPQPLAKNVSADNITEERIDIEKFKNSKIKLTLTLKRKSIKLKFTSVKNSSCYEIFRKQKNEKNFTLIGTTQKNQFSDKTVKSGKTYIYKVRAVLKQKEGQINGKCSNKIKKKYVKFDENKKMVALTFDDGPGKYTKSILKCLDKNDAHATFFVLGNSVNNYKSSIKKADLIGCEIGSHSFDHSNLSILSSKGIKSQMNRTDKKLKKIIDHGASLMRPPYGAINSSVKKSVKKPVITWNIDTRDWETRSALSTYKSVIKNARDGDIILMHDIHGSTKTAALKIIPELKKRGYQLVTVSELAEYKGVKLKNGEVYNKIKQ